MIKHLVVQLTGSEEDAVRLSYAEAIALLGLALKFHVRTAQRSVGSATGYLPPGAAPPRQVTKLLQAFGVQYGIGS